MIKCSQKPLIEALRALKKRFGNQAGITLEKDGRALRLYAFDDSMRARIDLTLLPTSDTPENPTSVTVGLKKLHDTIRAIKGARAITFSITASGLTVHDRAREHSLAATNHVTLDKTPREGGVAAKVSTTLLQKAIEAIAPMTSKDIARPNLRQVAFTKDRILAADGHMACVQERPDGARWPLDPGEELLLLDRDDLTLLAAYLSPHPCDCAIFPDEVVFTSRGFMFALSRFDGTYPNIKGLLDDYLKQLPHTLEIEPALLRSMIAEGEDFIPKCKQLYMHLSRGHLTLMTEGPHGCLWSGKRTVVSHSGKETLISVNLSLLEKAITMFEGARRLTILFDPAAPLKGITIARDWDTTSRVHLMSMRPSDAMKRRFDIPDIEIAA